MGNNEQVLRAGILGRVSHADAKGGGELERSIDEQLDENREACSAHDWAVAQEYHDAMSASRFARSVRADWFRCLADIAAGELDIVVVWETSRASRELEDWARFLTLCRKNQVRIYVTLTERLFDPGNAQDWKTLADAGVSNAYASEETSARTKRALRANARKGRPQSRCPYGYTRTYTVSNSGRPKLERQEIVAGQAAIVVEITRRIAGEEPISAIVADFNSRRVPVPWAERSKSQLWTRETIRKMIRNIAYLGKTVTGGMRLKNGKTVGGTLVDAVWPPISPDPEWPDLWYAANAVLDKPSRRTTRPGRSKYLLSYLAECEVCASLLSVHTTNRRAGGKRATEYQCSGPGHCVSAPVAAVDELVSEIIIGMVVKPDMLPRLVAGSSELAAQCRAEVAELQARKDEAADAYAAGKLSLEMMLRVEESLSPRIELASKRAAELTVPVPLRELAAADDVTAHWAGMAIASKREVVRVLFILPPTLDRGRTGPGRQGGIIPLRKRIDFPGWDTEMATEPVPAA